MRSIVTYETHHGSAKKLADAIAGRLNCLCLNVDTPFQAEDETTYDTLILVFGFRGPYTAQLTKLFIDRMKGKLNYKHLIVVGEGLFSEKEFPIVATSIQNIATPYSFHTYFMKGQLRVATLTPEEKFLLDEFSKITGMAITDMGEFDMDAAENIADKIVNLLSTLDIPKDANNEKTKWVLRLGSSFLQSVSICSSLPSSNF